MMKKAFVFLLFLIKFFAQETTGVTLIDSYITPEAPPRLVLFFYSSDSVFSKVKLDGSNEINISEKKTDEHKIEYNISSLTFTNNLIKGIILISKDNKDFYTADSFEIELNYEMKETKEKSYSLFTMCCLGGTVFGMPYPAFVIRDGKNYFSLNKEIAVVTFNSNSYRKFPLGYINVDYTFIDKSEIKHIFRTGYKHIIQTPVLEYLSPGLNFFTDFKGRNGISADLSVGLFDISSVFTLYTRYRYNCILNNSKETFHEISIGLYSGFFSINL